MKKDKNVDWGYMGSSMYREKTKLEKVMDKLRKNLTEDEIASLMNDRMSDILEGQKLGLL